MAIEKKQNLDRHIRQDAEYLFYIKLIATYALTFFGHIISVLATVISYRFLRNILIKRFWELI